MRLRTQKQSSEHLGRGGAGKVREHLGSGGTGAVSEDGLSPGAGSGLGGSEVAEGTLTVRTRTCKSGGARGPRP